MTRELGHRHVFRNRLASDLSSMRNRRKEGTDESCALRHSTTVMLLGTANTMNRKGRCDNNSGHADNTGVNNHGAQQRCLGSVTSLAPPPQGVPPIVMSPRRSVPSTTVQLPRTVSQTARSVPVTVVRSGRPVNLLVKFTYYKIK